MILRAPAARKIGTDSCAFSFVVLEFGSSLIALAGTPRFISRSRLPSVSPAPLTIILGATPERKSSAARVGRSPEPPPKRTMASAWAGPLSITNTCWGKPRAARINRTRSVAKQNAALRSFLPLTIRARVPGHRTSLCVIEDATLSLRCFLVGQECCARYWKAH